MSLVVLGVGEVRFLTGGFILVNSISRSIFLGARLLHISRITTHAMPKHANGIVILIASPFISKEISNVVWPVLIDVLSSGMPGISRGTSVVTSSPVVVESAVVVVGVLLGMVSDFSDVSTTTCTSPSR